MTPKKLKPKKITTKPETMFTAVWWLLMKLPTVPAKAPRAIKVRVNPVTNPNADLRVSYVAALPAPGECMIHI